MRTTYVVREPEYHRMVGHATLHHNEAFHYYLIDRILVRPESRHQSYASALLGDIVEEADRDGEILVIHAEPDDKAYTQRFQRWLKKYGFFLDENRMLRYPQ